MKFKYWLTEAEGYDFYKNLLLGKLSLDQVQGPSQGIDAWEPEQLISILNSLGEFKELPQGTQDQVVGQIKSGSGTLGDLIRIMSSNSRMLQGD